MSDHTVMEHTASSPSLLPPADLAIGPDYYAALADAVQTARADHLRRNSEAQALAVSIKASVHPSIWAAIVELREADGMASDAFHAMALAEVGRHMPGLATALAIVIDHVGEQHARDLGVCCVTRGPASNA